MTYMYEDYYEVQEYILNSECMNPEPQLDLSLLESIPKSDGVPPWMHKEEDKIPMVDISNPENHEPWFLLSNCDIDWGC